MAPTQACGERTAPFRLLIIAAAAVASTIRGATRASA